MQTAEKEEKAVNDGDKPSADPVYYISLLGVDGKGIVDEYEYIFDIYTRLFDFTDTDVKAKSSQDLWAFYRLHHKLDPSEKLKVDIYTIVECFIQQNSNGHFIIDECPILRGKDNSK